MINHLKYNPITNKITEIHTDGTDYQARGLIYIIEYQNKEIGFNTLRNLRSTINTHKL